MNDISPGKNHRPMPRCGEMYEDWYRASVNLMLDDFDEEYLRECSTATCPACGYEVKFDMPVVDRDGKFILGHEGRRL